MATPSAPDDLAVSHNEADHRFEALVDGQLAVCEYQLHGHHMVFTHTFVPSHLRGLGVAQKLVEVGLRFAQDHGRKVEPACSYVAAFISKRPEFQSLVS